MTALLALAGVLGLAVGSFLNVVVYRVPLGLSVVRPRSACPRCGKPIRSRDNVPVLSWLLLRGRCRDCGEPIAVRYPVVEAVTALLFVGVTARLVTDDAAALPVVLYLAAAGLALALIDLETHRLPDAIVLPSYPVVAVGLVLASWGTGDWGGLGRAGVGALGSIVLYLALWFAKPGGMGLGDVKLSGLLGATLAWLGWGTFAVGAFMPFLLGGVYAVALLVARRATRGSSIPFGPWMVLGAAVAFGAGQPLWDAYATLL